MALVLALVAGVVYVIMSIVVPELINTILSIIKAIPAALQRLDELIEPYGFSVSQMLSAGFTVPSASDVDAKIADMVNLLLKGAAFSHHGHRHGVSERIELLLHGDVHHLLPLLQH